MSNLSILVVFTLGFAFICLIIYSITKIGWFQHYLVPKTFEQSIGSGMLLMATTMIFRPYLAGLDTLASEYGIHISVNFFGAFLAVSGATLILKRNVGRKTFALLFQPIPIYATCLWLRFFTVPNVGAAAAIAFSGLSIAIAYMYAKRATYREWEKAIGNS